MIYLKFPNIKFIYFFFFLLLFCFIVGIMRRREIQSFTLKLSDLKEYETIRQERIESKNPQPNKTDGDSSPERSPMKIPLLKWGPKSKQEVRERIGLKS